MWCALFPGQGSQSPGMGRFLYDQFVSVRRLFEEASDELSLDFKDLCFEGSAAELGLTENTQPALLLVSTAGFRVLRDEMGFRPAAAAGHSVGEYAAVVAAGAVRFGDAIKAVRRRGRAMQAAVPVGRGGMTAVLNLAPEQVAELCAWVNARADGAVSPANLNAPGQIVISGDKSALDWLTQNYKPERFPTFPRAKLISLNVSAPFHCALMKPAEEEMRVVLGETAFTAAAFPVVQNVSATGVSAPNELRQNLVAQVCAPVRWIECVRELIRIDCRRGVEVGSGKVLAGLVKKIDSVRLGTLNINSLEELRIVENELKGAS